MMRIGFGYDVHRLVAGRPLVLGGVEIPFEKGCLGHSDADVLLHAVCDAILGAAALGDIGRHFPDTEEKYRGISSLRLLEETGRKLQAAGFVIINLDATLVLQKPKIAPFVDAMISTIATQLTIPRTSVSIKATTSEGLGFVGEGDGVVAYAVAVIRADQASG